MVSSQEKTKVAEVKKTGKPKKKRFAFRRAVAGFPMQGNDRWESTRPGGVRGRSGSVNHASLRPGRPLSVLSSSSVLG